MAHGQRTRYDYRNDYKGMTLQELKEQDSKTLDRMFDFLVSSFKFQFYILLLLYS